MLGYMMCGVVWCMVSLVEWRGWDRVSVDSGPASRRLMTPPVDTSRQSLQTTDM